MKANRAKDTKPERTLRLALREAGYPGYRLNWKSSAWSAGHLVSRVGRVAVFVHGCYWHHCPRCHPNLPKSNPEFWARKFELNRERDARKRRQLEEADWHGLRGLGVRHPRPTRRRGRGDLDDAGRASLARLPGLAAPGPPAPSAAATPTHAAGTSSQADRDVAEVGDDTEQQRRHQDGQPCREHQTRRSRRRLARAPSPARWPRTADRGCRCRSPPPPSPPRSAT